MHACIYVCMYNYETSFEQVLSHCESWSINTQGQPLMPFHRPNPASSEPNHSRGLGGSGLLGQIQI